MLKNVTKRCYFFNWTERSFRIGATWAELSSDIGPTWAELSWIDFLMGPVVFGLSCPKPDGPYWTSIGFAKSQSNKGPSKASKQF